MVTYGPSKSSCFPIDIREDGGLKITFFLFKHFSLKYYRDFFTYKKNTLLNAAYIKCNFLFNTMKRLKELESYYLALLIVRHAVRVPSTCSRCAGHVGELRKEKGGEASKALVHTPPCMYYTAVRNCAHSNVSEC